ncbi:MAG: porin [Betaproteobacteria bacterium]|nr:porin [Betaproteobacteria bacterium]
MNKKLLAVAVAGVLAAPTVALAQSSVTISGAVRMSVDNVKVSQAAATRTTTSESRLNDESSSIIFSVVEDLGGGLRAIVRADWKPNFDSSADALSGESYIGLSSNQWGRLTFGRHNFHFFKAPYDGYGKGGSLKTMPTSLVDFAGGGSVAIANATRTANSVRFNTPRWGGFELEAGYSFNPALVGGASLAEADMTAGNTARKGRAWNLIPAFYGKNWHIAYSYWSGKADAPTAATPDQRSDSLYGYYDWGGLRIGAIWNKSKLTAAAGALTGTQTGSRTAWSIPVNYAFGPHTIMGHYTKARDDKATTLVQDGAKMWTLAYAYSLSKRTSLQVFASKITNDVGATYNFFTSSGGLGSTNAALAAGEDARLYGLGMVHAF